MTAHTSGQNPANGENYVGRPVKKAAVLAEFHVCEPTTTTTPVVGSQWQHPRLPEVRGTVQSIEVFETVWTATVARWVLE